MRCISDRTAFADVGMTPAWAKRASVVRDTNSLGSPEASITAYTLNPAALASSAGNITQTLVQTPAMINVLLRGTDRLDEVFVVPGVDFTLARHVDRVRRGLMDFRHQRSIRPVGLGGGGDHGNLEQRRHLGEQRGIRPQFGDADVLDGLEEPRLMIEQQDHRVGGIEQRLPAAGGQHA